MTETTRFLRDLVALPSVNPMGRPLQGPEFYEHQVTAYLETFFRGLGVSWERQPVAPLRDNILARWESPGASKTVMLEVHQDTVPADEMSVAPFGAAIENGKLYGRGACDVKGGMAAMLAAFARVVREQPRGAMNVVVACTVDEEHTFFGVQELVRSGVRADFAIVAEPTCLDIVRAHKGVSRMVLTTRGRACHSSAPEQGINAIYRMGQVLPAIERYAERLRASRSDPLLGPPTLSVGRIEGGQSVNTIPDFCRIEIDRRLIPGEDVRRSWEEFRQAVVDEVGPDVIVDCPEPWMSAPPLDDRGAEEARERLGRAIDAIRGSHRAIGVPYGTDASTLAEGGIPSVVFGPGDIRRAHTRDEWVPLDEVEQAAEILYRMIATP